MGKNLATMTTWLPMNSCGINTPVKKANAIVTTDIKVVSIVEFLAIFPIKNASPTQTRSKAKLFAIRSPRIGLERSMPNRTMGIAKEMAHNRMAPKTQPSVSCAFLRRRLVEEISFLRTNSLRLKIR